MLIISCKKNLPDNLYNPESTETPGNIDYKSWLIKNGLSFKNGNINVKEVDGTEISGKLDWSNGEKYQFNGREYLEIPYIFDHQSSIYSEESSERSQFSLVFRNLPNEGLEAAIKSTTFGKIIQNKNTKIEGTVVSYNLINGDKGTLWIKNHNFKSFIKARRIDKNNINAGNTYLDLMRANCTDYTTVEYTVVCRTESDNHTYCSVNSAYTNYTICENNEEENDDGDWGGGGSGVSGNSIGIIPKTPIPSFTSDIGKLSCRSFNFKAVNSSTNWQEAGISGLSLMADWVGTNTPAIIKNFQTLYIGIPKNTIRDGNISPGKAAEFAANAANKAGKDLSIKYYGTPINIFNAIPASTIEAEFRTLMSNHLKIV